MRRLFRHAFVLTVAFAMVASAGAWQQCATLQLVAATTNVAHHPPEAAHHANGHGGHDHQSVFHQHAADDPTIPAPPAADDHGCMKCCAMCAVANAVLPAASAIVTVAASSRLLSCGPEMGTATAVAVDPGIPKRIV